MSIHVVLFFFLFDRLHARRMRSEFCSSNSIYSKHNEWKREKTSRDARSYSVSVFRFVAFLATVLVLISSVECKTKLESWKWLNSIPLVSPYFYVIYLNLDELHSLSPRFLNSRKFQHIIWNLHHQWWESPRITSSICRLTFVYVSTGIDEQNGLLVIALIKTQNLKCVRWLIFD